MKEKRCIISLPHSLKGWLGLLGAICAVLAAAVILLCVCRTERQPSVSNRLRAASEELTDCDVTLRLMPDKGEAAISETIRFRNDTGDTLDHLVLRTWLNAFAAEETSPAALDEVYDACYPEGFSAGALELFDVQWNGETAAHHYQDDARTALRIDIPPLKNGEEGTLFLRCVAVLPACAYRTGRAGGDWQMGNVIPVLSHFENGAWRVDPYSPIGDPFLSDCVNFTVAVYGAEGFEAACSAELERGADGVWRGSLPGARDLALCLSPQYRRAEGWAGNTKVISFAGTDGGARRALDTALRAVRIYSGLYGEYPYPTLTVCSAALPLGSAEYPGLCMIGEGNYLDSRADGLELEIAHAVAHQWFYALVGSDQVNDPWLDEALCEYAMLRYVRKRYGQGSFEALKALRVDAAMQENIPGTLTPGSPIDYFGSHSDYRAVVYGRGAALLLALDHALPGGVDGFLRAYAEAFAFRFATRAEFEGFLNRYAGMDLSPLLLDYLDTLM